MIAMSSRGPVGRSVRAVLAAIAAVAVVALVGACATSQNGTGTSSAAVTVAPSTSPASSTATPPAIASTSAPTHAPKPVAVNYCAGNTRDQFVTVSLRSQHMWLCHGSTTVLATAITSGASSLPYDSTPTGTFHIQGRDRNTVLTLNTGRQYNVKYWIPFSAPLFGFHDAPWQHFPYGSSKYKTDGSHGCVHMPLAAIAFFYHWVHVGTRVQIQA